MTRLLVSVRSAAEAIVALEGGAHIIDAKEPANGSLGSCSREVIAEIVEAIDGRVPVSAALGELTEFGADDCTVAERLPAGVGFAKLGLAGCGLDRGWRDRLKQFWSELDGTETQRVAVAYGDWERCGAPAPEEVIGAAQTTKCSYFLLDTKTKGTALPEVVDVATIRHWMQLAKAAEMRTVLAGSLGLEQMAAVIGACAPDIIGVRGAACVGGRGGTIAAEKVQQLTAALRAADDAVAPSFRSE